MDPLDLPTPLQTALQALYGHYEKTYVEWVSDETPCPPCFIVVCNNTSTSKLVYDYISGFERENEDGTTSVVNGRLELFRNFDEYGNRYSIPRTLLIDSQQLESGEKLSDDFRRAAAGQIERFRRERVERTGNREEADKITEQELLREVMNTVARRAVWVRTSAAWCRCPCSPRDGMPTPSPMCWACGPSGRNYCASKWWVGRSGASPTT